MFTREPSERVWRNWDDHYTGGAILGEKTIFFQKAFHGDHLLQEGGMARASLLLKPLVSEDRITLPWVISSSTDSILKSLGCQLRFTLTESLNEWMNDEWMNGWLGT